MMQSMLNGIAIIIAYCFGSLSSAIIVCKIMGLPDPRTEGSKNPGATNVLRIGGKKAAAITLLGDTLKGVIPILLAKWLNLPIEIIAGVAFATFIGHLFPLFFNFEGGKGVATFLGCLLALSWPSALIWLGIWIGIAILFRYSSLAAIIASFVAPISIWQTTHEPPYVYAITLMAIILLIRHKENIRNLWQGKETRIGQRKSFVADQAANGDKLQR